MKIGKFIKKIILTSLAALMAVTAIPYHSSVKAADDYPPEIQFPIRVLDFSQDSLLFEWQTVDSFDGPTFSFMGIESSPGVESNGKGMVEDTLGPDGVPVYKRETVEAIAKQVQKRLHWGNSFLNYNPNSYLNVRNYIGLGGEPVLTQKTNQNISYETIWQPENPVGEIRLVKVPNETRTYGTDSRGTLRSYNNVYAEVYDDGISSTVPIYILKSDAIVFFYNVSVSRTITLAPNSTYSLSGWWRQLYFYTEVYIKDKDGSHNMQSGCDKDNYAQSQSWFTDVEEVITGDDGELTVTIKPTPDRAGNRVGENQELKNPGGNNNQRYAVWNISLLPKTLHDSDYLGTNPNGGDVVYPLGDYDESKAKFDGNPDLGWTDMRTCMDYAYFVTSHFFKYHSSLNTQYGDYENLIFHKVEEEEVKENGEKEKKISYEFTAANRNPLAGVSDTAGPLGTEPGLIFNKTNKTIRNVYGDDTGNTTNGDVVKPGGSMYIADDAEHKYPEDIRLSDKWNGQRHNFHFTISSHSNFVYKEGANQYFYFKGDDDVYVFVNGHLYIDLGGAHSQLDGEINLDDLVSAHPEYGMEDGKVVSLDLFYMERHSPESNFYAKMNFKLATDRAGFGLQYDSIPYGYLVPLDYSLETLRELTTNRNLTFKDNFGNVIGAEGLILAEGVSLKDNKLKIEVKKKDGSVDDSRSVEFEFPNLYSYDPDTETWKQRGFTAEEIAKVQKYFRDLKLTQGEIITITGPQYDTSCKKYTEYDNEGGEADAEKQVKFEVTVSYDAWQEGASESTKGEATKSTPVTLLIGSIKVSVAQENNEKKELADYGEFTIDRDLYGESEYATKPSGMPYTNDPSATGSMERTFDQVPRGKYTIKLDQSVLNSYKVMINDEEVTEATIDFEPIYDSTNKTWIYPKDFIYDSENEKWIPVYDSEGEIRTFELRAKRSAPDLKDLT